MPFTFRTFLIQPHSMSLEQNKARTNALKQNCSQRVDGKWHSEVLQAKRSTNELGHFSSKALAENYSFTKFSSCFILCKYFHRCSVTYIDCYCHLFYYILVYLKFYFPIFEDFNEEIYFNFNILFEFFICCFCSK